MRMTNRMRMNRSGVLFGIHSLWIDLTDFFSEIEAAKRIYCWRPDVFDECPSGESYFVTNVFDEMNYEAGCKLYESLQVD